MCRCAVQLTLLGYILAPIFQYDLWWLVMMYTAFMLVMGTLEAVQSPAYTYRVFPSANALFACPSVITCTKLGLIMVWY